MSCTSLACVRDCGYVSCKRWVRPTCEGLSGLCMHHTLIELANLTVVLGGDTTAHEVRQRARCHNCGVKGNNTYQIVYTGNSDIAMDGAGVRSAKDV